MLMMIKVKKNLYHNPAESRTKRRIEITDNLTDLKCIKNYIKIAYPLNESMKKIVLLIAIIFLVFIFDRTDKKFEKKCFFFK